MPAPSRNAERHIQEAFANYRRYERSLTVPDDIAWASVFLFYSAIHLVNAYKIDKDPNYGDIDDHKKCNAYVSTHLRQISNEYKTLYASSRLARYKLRQFNISESRKFHDEHYNRIRRFMEREGFAWVTPVPIPQGDASTSTQTTEHATPTTPNPAST
jgi:hypothetical protein